MPTSGGNVAKCPTGDCTYANATIGPLDCRLWSCRHYEAHGQPPCVRLRCTNCKELSPYLDVVSNNRCGNNNWKKNKFFKQDDGLHAVNKDTFACPSVSQDAYNKAKLGELAFEPKQRAEVQGRLNAAYEDTITQGQSDLRTLFFSGSIEFYFYHRTSG